MRATGRIGPGWPVDGPPERLPVNAGGGLAVARTGLVGVGTIDRPPVTPSYDVFLSYSSADEAAVEEIATWLRDEAGLRVFLDAWHLVPGEPWIPALEAAIEASTAVAVFVGPEGMGGWHDQEKQLALVQAARERGRRVIPVLLRGASARQVEGFLGLRTWVDLDASDGLRRLVAGIVGKAPELVAELGAVRRWSVLAKVQRDIIDFAAERGRHTCFLGREDVLGEMDAWIEARDSGWLLVTGGPGLGKSALSIVGRVDERRRDSPSRCTSFDAGTRTGLSRPRFERTSRRRSR
jgi:TIR domain